MLPEIKDTSLYETIYLLLRINIYYATLIRILHNIVKFNFQNIARNKLKFKSLHHKYPFKKVML